MKVQGLFVNLPVADVARTRAFFSGLGFDFNPQFSDDKALCMVLNEQIQCMLLDRRFFQTFTHLPVADARVGWEVGPWEIVGAVTHVFQNRYATFGTFNINQGAPGGPQLERFLTPGQERQFRLLVTRAFGRDRD